MERSQTAGDPGVNTTPPVTWSSQFGAIWFTLKTPAAESHVVASPVRRLTATWTSLTTPVPESWAGASAAGREGNRAEHGLTRKAAGKETATVGGVGSYRSVYVEVASP